MDNAGSKGSAQTSDVILYQGDSLPPDPNEPGYAHIIFRPRPGGSITWAEASLQTALGLAAIRWDLDGDTLQVQLTVPPGAHATFQPPPGYAAKESTQLKGSHRLVLKKT